MSKKIKQLANINNFLPIEITFLYLDLVLQEKFQEGSKTYDLIPLVCQLWKRFYDFFDNVRLARITKDSDQKRREILLYTAFQSAQVFPVSMCIYFSIPIPETWDGKPWSGFFSVFFSDFCKKISVNGELIDLDEDDLAEMEYFLVNFLGFDIKDYYGEDISFGEENKAFFFRKIPCLAKSMDWQETISICSREKKMENLAKHLEETPTFDIRAISDSFNIETGKRSDRISLENWEKKLSEKVVQNRLAIFLEECNKTTKMW